MSNTKKAPTSHKEMISRLTQLEAGKKQVNRAQMSEIWKKLRGLYKQHPLAVLKLLGK